MSKAIEWAKKKMSMEGDEDSIEFHLAKEVVALSQQRDAADNIVAAILETGGVGSPRNAIMKEADRYMKVRGLPLEHFQSIVRPSFDEGEPNGA